MTSTQDETGADDGGRHPAIGDGGALPVRRGVADGFPRRRPRVMSSYSHR